MTDSTATVRARYDYDTYGAKSKITGNLDCDFGFTGHYYHAGINLHLALYRAYDQDTGRWLSADPLGEEGGLNLYGYVGGDPMNTIDPLGLRIEVHVTPAFGGGANHAFVYSTETGRQFGRNASCSRLRTDPVGGGELNHHFDKVEDLNGMTETEFMDALEHSTEIDDGLWLPVVNDCHQDLESAFKKLGVKYPKQNRFNLDWFEQHHEIRTPRGPPGKRN